MWPSPEQSNLIPVALFPDDTDTTDDNAKDKSSSAKTQQHSEEVPNLWNSQ